jgi:galactokinase/mevalonate kinase-like predicted kinase
MTRNRNRIAARLRVRHLVWLLFSVAASIAVVAVISSSHATDQAPLFSFQHDLRDAADIPATAGQNTDSAAVSALLATTHTKRKLPWTDAAYIAAWLAGNEFTGSTSALGDI